MTTTPEIIIIDDNLLDVELMATTLKDHKIVNDILIFNDGDDALKYFFCKKDHADRNINYLPKIIFLNNKLQNINGLKILKKIKENDRTKSIPIVMLSSSLEEKEIIECYKLGANSYIVKPVVFNEFSDTICNIVRYWLLLNETPK